MPLHLQREIEILKRKILSLGTMGEEALSRAIKAVETRDARLAQRVIDNDESIDQTEIEVEEECLKILALHQPVAIDLRFIVAALKINNDLERVGDMAVNIAERALFLSSQPAVTAPFDLHGMTEKVRWMLSKSLDALVQLDGPLAKEICAKDDEIDELNRQAYDRVLEGIRWEPGNLERMLQYLSISRHLERVGDHATNIAEDVLYMTEGEIVRHRIGGPQGGEAGART